jgi:hypothetical protein
MQVFSYSNFLASLEICLQSLLHLPHCSPLTLTPCLMFTLLPLFNVHQTALVHCSTHCPCPLFNKLPLSTSTHCPCPLQHTALVHFNTLPLSNVHHNALVYFKTFPTLFFTLPWYTAHHSVLTQCPLCNNIAYFVKAHYSSFQFQVSTVFAVQLSSNFLLSITRKS